MDFNWHLIENNDFPEIGEIVLCELAHRIFTHGKYITCKYRAADKYKDEPYFDWDHNGFPNVIAWCRIKERE